MEMIFNPTKLLGPLWRLPEITTNGNPEKKKVCIDAYVYKSTTRLKHPIVMDHPRIDLPQFGDEIIDSARLKIKNISRQDLHITIIESPEEITVTIPDIIKPGDSADIEVKLNEDARDLQFWKSITFELDDPENCRFTIPVEKSQRLPEMPSR